MIADTSFNFGASAKGSGASKPRKKAGKSIKKSHGNKSTGKAAGKGGGS